MRDRRAPELGDVLDEMGARHEVDRDGVLLAGDVERRRLAGDPHELLEVRDAPRAHVETREDGVREAARRGSRAIAPGSASCSTRPVRGERAELAARRCWRQPGPGASSFVPTSPASASASRIATARCDASIRPLDG